MTYDKNLLHQKLIEFMGKNEFKIVDAANKTGLAIPTIRSIIYKKNISYIHSSKILNILGFDICRKTMRMKLDAFTDDQIIKVIVDCDYKKREAMALLGITGSLELFNYALKKRGLMSLSLKNKKEKNKKEKKEVVVPPQQKYILKTPIELGQPDPLANFDYKAELKKIRGIDV